MKTPLPSPDLEQAARFLDWLAPDEAITFQTLPEGPDPEFDKHLLRTVLHGRFPELANKLAAHNMMGTGVFFMVNRGDGIVRPGAQTCRTAANVQHVRALFVDLDGNPPEPVAAHQPPPQAVIQSSPGKWHAYWKISDCPLEHFKAYQKRLAMHFKADPAVCDLPRVMRVPGFWHQKAIPFLSEIVHLEA